jgi:hypothetical protein
MSATNDALSASGGFGLTNVVFPNVPVIASAATIAPTNDVTRVTGTVPIATITPPNAYFNGPLALYSTDASPFTTVTTGNIALASTAVQFKLMFLVFDPSTSKWYPSY